MVHFEKSLAESIISKFNLFIHNSSLKKLMDGTIETVFDPIFFYIRASPVSQKKYYW